MIYANMTPEGRTELDAALKAAVKADWYRRVKLIDLSAQGKTVSELAELFDVCQATVRSYIHRYNTAGLAGLRRQPGSGPPAKIPFSKTEWAEVLHQSPSQFPRLQRAARNWTQELVVAYLAAYHQVQVTQSAISKHLQALGFRWNRGKLTVTSPDPAYVVKRERVET